MAITLTHVVKTYRTGPGVTTTAVDDLTLSVADGEVLALVGPSGSGKSTVLHLVAGLERPDSGSIEVDGRDVGAMRNSALDRHRRQVGFIFQRFNLIPSLTALDNVIAPVLPLRTRFDKRSRALDLLSSVGLADRAASMPTRMSGGQQQRIAIARALMGDPSIVLADEPTGSLDTSTGADILDLVLGLRDRLGVTIVLASHDPAVAARCDRVITLRDGRIDDETRLHDRESTDATWRRLAQNRP